MALNRKEYHRAAKICAAVKSYTGGVDATEAFVEFFKPFSNFDAGKFRKHVSELLTSAPKPEPAKKKEPVNG